MTQPLGVHQQYGSSNSVKQCNITGRPFIGIIICKAKNKLKKKKKNTPLLKTLEGKTFTFMIAFCTPDVKILHQFALILLFAHIPCLRVPSKVDVEKMEEFYMDLINKPKHEH